MVCAATVWLFPFCPRTPRNAPVPPIIAKLPCATETGALGGGGLGATPVGTMVPIALPSLFRISNVSRATPFRAVSAIAWGGRRTEAEVLEITRHSSFGGLAIDGDDVPYCHCNGLTGVPGATLKVRRVSNQ